MENLDLIDVGIDDSNFVTEFDDTIEYEFSENISILYDKFTKQYRIEGLDEDTFDEYIIDIEEPFEDMEIDGVLIRKSDFEEFKELVLKSA